GAGGLGLGAGSVDPASDIIYGSIALDRVWLRGGRALSRRAASSAAGADRAPTAPRVTERHPWPPRRPGHRALRRPYRCSGARAGRAASAWTAAAHRRASRAARPLRLPAARLHAVPLALAESPLAVLLAVSRGAPHGSRSRRLDRSALSLRRADPRVT